MADFRQRVIPMLAYRDARAAIEFLCSAFGFREQFRMEMADGRIGHAEIAPDAQRVMLASETLGFLMSPLSVGGVHAQLLCYVDDVDAHFAAARSAGATLIGAPEDQSHGDRSYRALDPEGHRWIFATPLAAAAAEGAR